VLKRDYSQKFSFASELHLELLPKDATPDVCVYPKMSRVIGQQADVVKMKDPTIEILSPALALDFVIEKIRQQYFPNGVQSSWVIISSMRAVALYVPGKPGYQFFTSGTLTDPATGISVAVEELFEV
jgi:Uma2 family endonuclease